MAGFNVNKIDLRQLFSDCAYTHTNLLGAFLYGGAPYVEHFGILQLGTDRHTTVPCARCIFALYLQVVSLSRAGFYGIPAKTYTSRSLRRHRRGNR